MQSSLSALVQSNGWASFRSEPEDRNPWHFARVTWNLARSMIPTDEYIPLQSHEKWQDNAFQGSFEHQTPDVLMKTENKQGL